MNRKINALQSFLVLLMVAGSLSAQDLLPRQAKVHERLISIHEHMMRSAFPIRQVTVPSSMPLLFKDTLENKLIRSEKLDPFFRTLLYEDTPARIVHIGDSHVRGHVYTVAARRALEQAWGDYAVLSDSITYRTSAIATETGRPGVVYHGMGINGAVTSHFTREEKVEEITALKPDLLILSFGTNESHGRNYNAHEHRLQLDSIVTLYQRQFRKAVILLTTPPGSYIRPRRGQRVINTLTPKVTDTILAFAEERDLPVWDLYHIVGGSKRACVNWVNLQYMQRDRVHYTHAGYNLQGRLLSEAILKAYNDYVASGLE